MGEKSIVPLPIYAPSEIKYIIEVCEIIDGKKRINCSVEPIIRRRGHSMSNKDAYEIRAFYSQYIYKKTKKLIYGQGSNIIVSDPLEPLHILQRKHKQLPWDKFIKKGEDKFRPDMYPFMCNSYWISVTYLSVREEIVSYLLQKIGIRKEIIKLQKLFENKNENTFEEYIEKECDQLLNLDLDSYVDYLNNDTSRREKNNETYSKIRKN